MVSDAQVGARRGFVSVLALLAMSCGPLFVTVDVAQEGPEIHILTRRLGEYAVVVRRLRIIEERTQRTIWEIVQPDPDRTTIVADFHLRVGENNRLPERLREFGFEVSVPSCGESFRLESGRSYVVEVLIRGTTFRCRLEVPHERRKGGKTADSRPARGRHRSDSVNRRGFSGGSAR